MEDHSLFEAPSTASGSDIMTLSSDNSANSDAKTGGRAFPAISHDIEAPAAESGLESDNDTDVEEKTGRKIN